MRITRPTSARPPLPRRSEWQGHAARLGVLLLLHRLGAARAAERRRLAWQRCVLALNLAVTQYFLSVDAPRGDAHGAWPPPPKAESPARKATVTHSVSAG